MPVYVYECPEKHITERVKSIKADIDVDVCGECGAPAQIIPTRVSRPILVGDGFHENDYRHGRLGS